MSKDEVNKPNGAAGAQAEHLNLKVKSQVRIYLLQDG